MTTPAADWETKEWIEYADRVEEKQNMLCRLDLVSVLCRIIAYSEDRQVIAEAVLVCIAMLLGGNPHVQESFMEYMVNDRDNLFLQKIRKVIVQNFS